MKQLHQNHHRTFMTSATLMRVFLFVIYGLGVLSFLVVTAPVLANQVPTISDVVGPVPVPPGTDVYNAASGNADNFGLLYFLSNLIKVITVVAGIWVVFNVVWAGFLYLTQSGKSSAAEKVRNLLFMSVLGLLLIISSYTIAGLVGLLVFGDAGYIINPQIPTPGQ